MAIGETRAIAAITLLLDALHAVVVGGNGWAEWVGGRSRGGCGVGEAEDGLEGEGRDG